MKYAVFGIITLMAFNAHASEMLDGANLTLWWAMPFAGLLLSLALGPILIPQTWHHHYGKISALWAGSVITSLLYNQHLMSVNHLILATMLHDYVPFICLIGALYIISGGIAVRVNAPAKPLTNIAFLTVGTLLASLVGTTGAAMLLIRPLLTVNRIRQHKTHTIVFFIFLVCNIGGCLTPLGDPPLFLGFLNGVSFFWVTKHLMFPMLLMVIPLLAIYGAIDLFYYTREKSLNLPFQKIPIQVSITGAVHLVYLGLVISLILVSAVWHPGYLLSVGTVNMPIENVIRDLGLIVTAWISFKTGSQEARLHNEFSWAPLIEVAKLFAAIFVVAIPIIAILQAGEKGVLHNLVSVVNVGGKPLPAAYFWLTGALSGFLDNAPTYLIFYNIAGGHAPTLMTEIPLTLTAISLGAVFMGAVSYIGNAPNFMVKAIAESRHFVMPGFFGYLLWSFGILMPLFMVLTYVLF